MKLQLIFFISFICFVAATGDEKVSTPENVCEPGKTFVKDCSTCQCNAEGTEYTCEEKKNCPSTQVPQVTPQNEETCTPGELYKVKCNQCKCPESGLKSQASCTVIGCPDE